ncbi:MAG: octaprenyl diphosphate synthase [Gammaproteobacteria bacterium]|nr:polyprenyl synthetase family protein [Gammaproteobacteria bacterium]NNC97679.1 octaprenyl diphosphate synthase [Gammaproteobacteria bacterium]NNM12855.1 octaprenyl diphosphate synthase [Gammaproteobacteria bacterium]
MDKAVNLVAQDFQAVNKLITAQLQSDVVLINQISQHIIHSGGKRLRPLLVLLAAHASGYQGKDHIAAAAIIEFIHTATLLHDDVVDDSELRRGSPTANNLFGNAASVLVGDFLYSRSFQMMVELNNLEILDILADATNRIAEGEVLQLLNIQNAETTEAEYFAVIDRKTATLFAAGMEIAGILSETDKNTGQALAAYGSHLGFAFQLVDDLLDYQADANELGKSLGDDLAEGKPTLPLIRALQFSKGDDKKIIQDAIEVSSKDYLEEVLRVIAKSDALQYTENQAFAQADKAKAAIQDLPDSDHKKCLLALADFAVKRDS